MFIGPKMKAEEGAVRRKKERLELYNSKHQDECLKLSPAVSGEGEHRKQRRP